jgi:hypothetical protein
VVLTLVGFIGASLEEVRKKLVEEAKRNRSTEQARRLAQAANKIAEAINEDFRRQQNRLNEIDLPAFTGPG